MPRGGVQVLGRPRRLGAVAAGWGNRKRMFVTLIITYINPGGGVQRGGVPGVKSRITPRIHRAGRQSRGHQASSQSLPGVGCMLAPAAKSCVG